MNNEITHVAPKHKTVEHSMSPNNRISFVCGNLQFWVQEILETSVQLDGDQNNAHLEIVIESQNNQRQEKYKSYYQQYNVKILRDFHKQEMIKLQIYKKEHTCKAKLYVQFSRDTVSNNSYQHGKIKVTHNEQ